MKNNVNFRYFKAINTYIRIFFLTNLVKYLSINLKTYFMKKLILTLSMSLLLFCSCSDNEAFEKQNNESKISAVLKEENYDTQKIMYRMLSNEEKLQLWQDKLSTMIQIDELNEKQIDLIKDLKAHLNADLFDNNGNNDKREIFKNVYAKDFLKKSQSLFTPKYFTENFYNISNRIAIDDDGPNKPDCTCNQSSIWSCVGLPDCKASDKCDTTTDGCGFLGFSECDGRCYVQ